MSKVKANLIKVNLKHGNNKLACKLALQVCGEGSFTGDYESVYLPNAYELVQSSLTPSQWAGYLSALERDGDYRSQGDGFFGLIKQK